MALTRTWGVETSSSLGSTMSCSNSSATCTGARPHAGSPGSAGSSSSTTATTSVVLTGSVPAQETATRASRRAIERYGQYLIRPFSYGQLVRTTPYLAS
jgi:hypothetical protein